MFSKWRERRRRNREIVDRLYEAVIERARRPRLFEECGVPDTVMGRFEALSLQMFLFLRRCRTSDALRPIAQDMVDRFIVDMDDSLRQIGIGDQSVPKRMRKLTGRFYERVDIYDKALASADPHAALIDGFSGRALDAECPRDVAGKLARETLDEEARLAAVPESAILSGSLSEEGR
ncbi:ubiquinol-cytochrome C chaperone family protein [Fulvimarina sp. 2208YS6-2-32]|uniref:Ubiquinol-cytochrome C chaperone family protein n=1 Tax=Fulvimarina uroteuthidis TaxID=3098149 RepID=A0ABU5I2L3_9HYPH|nr:ubiquinol-cytochrome C chaperone family protein [Fulvimarina sp. 2208YS6-2-32]MDY8109609.1 ubiquinol-cytochrome C chaperone family protein [Fulvimarina sp. 2208YS6-2-32]